MGSYLSNPFPPSVLPMGEGANNKKGMNEMKNPKLFYIEQNPSKKFTMKRAMPEWCNLDCPTIWYNDGKMLWRINSGGLYIESLPEEIRTLFILFVKKSSEAFYKKYPQCRSVPGKNGFLDNLNRINNLHHFNTAR